MGTLYRAKSDNFWGAAAVGATNQWVHLDAGFTGRLTISPAIVATSTSGAIKPIILQSVTVNSSGASGTTVVTDSARGIALQLKVSVAEKDYHYNIPFRGSLVIDNNSGSDLTVAYIRD